MRGRRLARALGVIVCVGLGGVAVGCVEEHADPVDAGVEAGGPTRCGSGEAEVQLGVEHPFVAVPEHRFPIDQGRQGGHHFDISVRLQGALDPDHADVELLLFDGETRLARHYTADWLLHIDEAGPWCDYPRARLVLLDTEGGLLPVEQVEGLIERSLRLEVSFVTPRGDANGTFEITPTEIRPL